MNEDGVKQLIQQALFNSQFEVAKVPVHEHNGVDSPRLPYSSIVNNPNQFCVATLTNGTTPVSVFSGTQFNATITGVFLVSLDTTAGTITVKNNGNTIATIAKGTTAGAMVGATNLSTGTLATLSKGNPFTIVSSSVGNANVFITFTS